jgi:hypothetical protein
MCKGNIMTKRGPKHNPKFWPDEGHDVMLNKAKLMSKTTFEPNGCWHYHGPRHKQGYGFISALRKSDQRVIQVTAHRASYRLFCGPITQPNINHTCHNTQCINPAHLYNGTQKQNVQDTINAGRMPHGHKERKPKQRPDAPFREVKQRNRVYRYTEEDIQFGRTASLDDIQARWNLTRAQAVGRRHEFYRGYKWLAWPEQKQ